MDIENIEDIMERLTEEEELEIMRLETMVTEELKYVDNNDAVDEF